MKRRQKLIQLADTSELGWRVVTEYETNPIASDSEDEKRIHKAEARANRKAKTDRAKKRTHRYTPYGKKPTQTAESTSGPVTTRPQVQRKRPGLCFGCGMPGHWKHECLNIQNNANNKISNILQKYTEKEKCVSQSEERQNVSIENKNTEDRESSPVGRLKKHVNKWKEMSDNKYIIDVIENGYKIPFKQVPAEAELKNNKSARDNIEFVNKEIQALLTKGVISEVKEKPKVINPLTVAYNRSGKPRLVLDCRHINPCIHLFKVKFEDIKTAVEMFEPNSFLYTFDLKSAYHHIDICTEHKTYLGFSIKENGASKYFIYNSLPFGIASAGHIFTKTLRVAIKMWRSNGQRVVMFLDDGIGGDKDYATAVKSSRYVRESLNELGFMLAIDKCVWEPTMVVIWLGHILNFNENRLLITEDRIMRLENTVRSILFQIRNDKLNLVAVRFLASVVGQIISLQSVFGKLVSRMTRYLYKCIITRASWNAPVIVCSKAEQELVFWHTNALKINKLGKALEIQSTVQLCVYTDASASGYGGYIVELYQALNEEYLNQRTIDISQKSLENGYIGKTLNVSPNKLEQVNLPEVRKENKEIQKYTKGIKRLPEVSKGKSTSTKMGKYMFPEENKVNGTLIEVNGDKCKLPEVSREKCKLPEVSIEKCKPPEVGSKICKLPEVNSEKCKLPEVSSEHVRSRK